MHTDRQFVLCYMYMYGMYIRT